jgi:hypothetical protein
VVFDTLVVSPDNLITAVVSNVKDLPVTQNRYPHITVFTKNLQPSFSNDLLEEVFRVNIKKQVYKVDVRLNNKNT